MEITDQELNERFEKLKQEILLMIPAIVVSHIQAQHKYKKIVDDFYLKHPDLVSEKVLIGSLANKIAADNPTLEPEEIFLKTGKQARKILRKYNDEKL